MDWRQKLIAEAAPSAQRQHLATAAIHDLDDALQRLAVLGCVMHIEEGPAPKEPQEWPKLVFHIRQGQREVRCQADLDELGEDWYPSMEEARQAAGMAKQWQRGGVFTKSLPAPLSLVPSAAPKPPPPVEPSSRRRRLNGATPARYPVPAVIMPGTN
jgi:hypothetical protein